MGLKISVAGSTEPPVDIDAPPSAGEKHQRWIDIMIEAIESENGVELTLPNPALAKATRTKLYRARDWFRAQGSNSLDNITIQLVGSKLNILPPIDIQIARL